MLLALVRETSQSRPMPQLPFPQPPSDVLPLTTRSPGGRAREYAGLAAAASELVGNLGIADQLRRIARRAHSLLDADYAAVATVEPDGKSVWRAVDGAITDAWRTVVFEPGRGTAGRILARNGAVVIDDFPHNPEFPVEEFPAHAAEGMRTALGVPLRTAGAPFGAIVIAWRRPVEISDDQIALGQTLADLASVAIRNAELFVESSERAERFKRVNAELEATQDLLERQAADLEEHASRTERLNLSLHESNEELRRATSIKERFFAQMSHELRTPINAILGYSTLITDGIMGPVPGEVQQMLTRIRVSGRHLLELVNDVLDISRLEANKVALDIRDFDLAELARDALFSVDPQARSKGLELLLEAPEKLSITSDPARVRQIILNLASNAVKFTQSGRVALEVGLAGQDWVEITVADTGVGISPENIDRVFEEFAQVGKGDQGTGLGLTISRRLATLLGGHLSASSEFGRGSRFTLKLPAHGARAETPPR